MHEKQCPFVDDPTPLHRDGCLVCNGIRAAVAEATTSLEEEKWSLVRLVDSRNHENQQLKAKVAEAQAEIDRQQHNRNIEGQMSQAALAEERVAVRALSAFWTAFIEAAMDGGFWGAGDMDSEDLWQTALASGLVEKVRYNPETHGEIEDAEPGDEIWHLTELGQRLSSAAILAQEVPS